MKLEKNFLVFRKNEGGGASGIDWNLYENVGSIDIFIMFVLPRIEKGSVVHLMIS